MEGVVGEAVLVDRLGQLALYLAHMLSFVVVCLEEGPGFFSLLLSLRHLLHWLSSRLTHRPVLPLDH